MSDELVFADEGEVLSGLLSGEPWKVMIIDDEEEVHSATRLSLGDYVFMGRGLEFISAFSAREGREKLSQSPDAALMLLDVVMETDNAGLDFAKQVRREMANPDIRIILRTGQPGLAPEEQVIVDYDINDYKCKTELTSARLFSSVTSALRAFNELKLRRKAESELEELNLTLEEKVKLRTSELTESNRKLSDEIRERKKLQDQLIMSERMAAIGTLAGGVAHEFNNINVSVLGYADIVLGMDGLPEDVQVPVTRIRKAALRAKSISGNLMSFSSGKTGGRTGRSMAELTREVVDFVREEFAGEGITIKENYGNDAVCMMDDRQIGQVILNVLTNARHALDISDKKVIDITTGRKASTGFVRILDTGCGIAKDDLGKLFLPFFSRKGEKVAGKSPLSNVKGTGLGLSVSHTIVAQHGGEIKVHSDEGKGSVFTIELPLEGSAKISESDAEDKPKAKNSIMLIEAEKDVAALVSIVMKQEGYDLRVEDSGSDALFSMVQSPVRIAICDVNMSGLSIESFARKISILPPEKRPVMIAITENAAGAGQGQEWNNDFFITITKPLDIQEVREAVSRANKEYDIRQD